MKGPIALALWLAALPAIADPPSQSQHPEIGRLTELKFAADSAHLPPDAAPKLGRALAWAKQHPDGLLLLDGHSDRTGTRVTNFKLSLQRANAVRDALESAGVDPDQVVVAAYGDEGPHRERFDEDRRVTIWSTRAGLEVVMAHTITTGGIALVHPRSTVAHE